MQKARRHAPKDAPTACRQTGSGSISLPCSGFFSPFPHGTCSLSVFRSYLVLRDGPRRFTQNSSCSALLRIPPGISPASGTGLSPSADSLSRLLPSPAQHRTAVLLPRERLDIPGLDSSAFARHYLRNHYCFLLLRVLRCFSSPRSPPLRGDGPPARRVAPFGCPRITGHLHLPAAFRSLSRPSSPPKAKASTVCPSLFSLRTAKAGLHPPTRPIQLALAFLFLLSIMSMSSLENSSP